MADDEIKKLLADYSTEMRRHFDVAVESIKNEVKIVAEGVTRGAERLNSIESRLEHIDSRLGNVETKVDQLTNEMRASFADTRAMIKFSHSELDRRIRTLEDGFADLQTRVERLEGGSTH